jgi:hypothetical protein
MPNGKNGTTIFTDFNSALLALGFILPVEILWVSIYMIVSIAAE